MQLFKYKGYDVDGKKIEGEITGITIDEVERKVTAQAVTIISIIPAGAARGGAAASSGDAEAGGFKLGRKKFSDADLAVVLRDLAVMAQTGVPFVEALDAVIETARTHQIQEALIRFKSEIVGGKSLSAGMKAANNLFPVLVCDMVKIAEEGGRLDRALDSAAAYVERAADLRRKVMNALLYPIVLTVIAGGTVVIMVMFVMPKFADIFTKMGVAVPASTRAVLDLGIFMKGHPFQLLFGVIGFVVGLKMILRLPTVNRFIFSFLMRVPVLGDLMKKLALSRSCQSIATLLNSNVAMLAALEHGAKVAGNPILRDAINNARTSVERGSPLSDSLKETKAFPPTLVRMVAVGERTGQLPLLMNNTAAHMEEEVDGKLKALISIVEPVMIVVMGIIVGGITMSIIIPMYSIVENVH
ncbi:MAG TPA: type II secretion system F family protein [Fimbriimonadaceae bacterium]|jgi:type IV pilus assembly protein PilC